MRKSKVKKMQTQFKFKLDSLVAFSGGVDCPDKCDPLASMECHNVEENNILYGKGYRVYAKCDSCDTIWATKKELFNGVKLPIDVKMVNSRQKEEDEFCKGKTNEQISEALDNGTYPPGRYGYDKNSPLYKTLVNSVRRMNNAVFDRIEFGDNMLKLPWSIEINNECPYSVNVTDITGADVMWYNWNACRIDMGAKEMQALVDMVNKSYTDKVK